VIAVYAVQGPAWPGNFTDALGVADALKANGYGSARLFADRAAGTPSSRAAAVTVHHYAFGDACY